jgi:two-component system, OmpR family, response regulator
MSDIERPPWNLSVLLVDNHRDAVESLAEVLSFYGYDIRVAYSSDDALMADPADIVIMELRLPRMDGWEMVRRMRQQSTEKQPLYVAVTTCAMAADRQRSAIAGIDLHLIKPVDPSILVGMMRRFGRVLS